MDEREQMEILHKVFDETMPRLGPGDDASTRKALSIALDARAGSAGEQTTAPLRILDLGCGTGNQTMQLAMNIDGTILAVDNHQPYLDELDRRAQAAGLGNKIQTHLGDMDNLEFDDCSFDLIWSEGALFVMGFDNGLKSCLRLLAPGGALAVTELCWLRGDVPEECREFFVSEYPPMTDVETNLAMIASRGYRLLEHWTLPDSAWLEHYYLPLEKRLPGFRREWAADPEKLEMIQMFQTEIDMFRKYSSYYGYVFFVMQR